MTTRAMVLDTETRECVDVCDTEEEAWARVHELVTREHEAEGFVQSNDPLRHEHYTVAVWTRT